MTNGFDLTGSIKVSIIIPAFNEGSTIELLLEGILRQTYPLEQIEVVIADGMSSDDTRGKIAHFAQNHPILSIKVVDNPQRIIPAGVNRAIAAASGDILVRLDAHSVPNPEYVMRSIKDLEEGLGDNVGGVWEIHPGGSNRTAEAIALAASHPFAVGDAYYRFTKRAQLVDTVPFGAFKRQLLAILPPPSSGIGPFDESLPTNEDYEFNARIRKIGGKIWLDPEIRTIYFARSSLAALSRQYWRYGFWKFKMLRRYPRTIRWRQALPPLFVLSFWGLGGLSLFASWAGWLLLLQLGGYFLAVFSTSLRLALRQKKTHLLVDIVLAIAVMHIVWGQAFLWSMLESILKRTHDI